MCTDAATLAAIQNIVKRTGPKHGCGFLSTFTPYTVVFLLTLRLWLKVTIYLLVYREGVCLAATIFSDHGGSYINSLQQALSKDTGLVQRVLFHFVLWRELLKYHPHQVRSGRDVIQGFFSPLKGLAKGGEGKI